MQHPDMSDLTKRAATIWAGSAAPISAAAQLFGVIRSESQDCGIDDVQAACALLARSDEAWRPPLVTLPDHPSQGVTMLIRRIASFATGILNRHGPEAVRAALAFWATERDPARWQIVMALPPLR